MNKAEVNTLLEYLSLNYPDFKITDELFNMWLDELQQYDNDDVMKKIKDMLSTGHYTNRPPVLMSITSGLTKKNKKLDWKKTVVFCPICNKGFNCKEDLSSPELKEHEDRCRSIQYVIKQMKKWYGVKITRGELWALPKEEFDAKYDKLLHYIYDHTTNQDEKDIIGYIFNPPSAEATKKFFGITDEEE